MTTTTVQKNILSELQKMAMELLSIKARMVSLVAMYTNESIASVTDADLAELAEFAHISAAELQAAGGALAATNAALGDYSTGSNVSKLLKIVVGVPG